MTALNLDELRAVPGVEGAFLCRWSGEVLVNTLVGREVTDVEVAAGTLVGMARAAQGAVGESVMFSLNFGSAKMRVATLQQGVLCVCARPDANRRLLEVVMRIIGRRFDAQQAAAPPASVPPRFAPMLSRYQ